MLIGKFFKNINSKYKKHFFSGLSFNSLTCKKNNIFFAIKGNKTDGNKFIENAIKKGAKTIVYNNKFHGLKNNVLFISTRNVRKLLSETSSKIFKNKPKNLIAVTGTNGKSSISDFYFQILFLCNLKVASIGTLGVKTNFNKIKVSNTTLDPISLNSYLYKLKKKKINNVILEASSHGLKQNRLDGLDFKIGIFTNITHDHLDYHKTFKDYLNSKLYLFNKLIKKNNNIITDFEIPEYKIIKKIALKNKLHIKTISNNKKSDLVLISHKYENEKQIVKIKYKNNYYIFSTNLVGRIQIKNILMSMIAAEKSNLDFKKIVNVINKIKPVKGRLQKIGNIKNNSLAILDYAHTPDALKICLQNIKDQFKNRKINLVFGCGGYRDKIKRPKMGKIANNYCDKIYLTDDNPRNENPKKIRADIKKTISKSKLKEIPNRETAIRIGIEDLNSGEILVVAGKGHEEIQDYGYKKKIFSDKNYILKYINKKNKNLSKDFKLNILNEGRSKKKIFLKKKIRKASINSKEVKKNDIFFAIKGKKKDGNLFIKEAFKNGASLAVVNKLDNSIKKSKQIKSKNTLKYLTKKSEIIRENTKAKIIAITGSSGKTSLKELLGRTFGKFSKTTYSPKSYNNKFGVPLSLFNLRLSDEFGIFEVGMDKAGEINFLTKIIKPDVGIITNISYAHAKNFRNINKIAQAKAEIIYNIQKNGYLILNADDKFFSYHKEIALKKNIKVISFSINKKNSNVSLNYIKRHYSKFKVSISINNKNKYFFVNSNFENNLKNILASLCVILIFKKINLVNKNIFLDHRITSGRGDISKIKFNNKSFFLVDESYNSNPISAKSAIKNFDFIKVKNNKKCLILGDMLELGKHSKKQHLQLSKIINSTSINNVNVYGKSIRETYKNIRKNQKGLILNKKSEIIDLIKNNINNNDYLMIKGSNSTGLHHLASYLKRKNSNAL